MGQAGYRPPLLIGLLVCPLAWLVPPAAAAQPRPSTVQLAWSVPEGSGCATEDELRLQVERLSERQPFEAPGAGADYTIAAAIEPFETAWRARIALRDAHGGELGQREVIGRSPTCRTLNVPVALVIVTLADSLLEDAGAAHPSQAELPPERGPAPRSGAPQDAEPAAAFALGLGAFAAFDFGLLPSATPGFGAAVEPRLPLPIAIEAAIYAPVDELDAQRRGARFVLWHFGLAVCPELRVSSGVPLRTQLCGSGLLGAVDAAGRGLTEARSALRLVAVLGFEPKLVWLVSDAISVRASILAGWVLARPSFRVDIEGQAPRILKSDPVALQLRVGVMGFAF